jgi:uncharacterized protein (DUF427 family)
MDRRVSPGPGQESVWDYPRPPLVDPTDRHVRIELNGMPVADTRRALRVLETSHPPGYYVPLADVREEVLVPTAGSTWCEWKGVAAYFDVVIAGAVARRAAWGYSHPSPGYERLADHVSFYAGRLDAWLDGERVRAQPGSFYGGWITRDVVGPFKGEPGSEGW